jgi:geranylgeranyl diphosphate synthase, type I
LFAQFMQRYLSELDNHMRQVVNTFPADAAGFDVMLKYPLGWVDEQGQPYPGSTGKRIRPTLLLLCAESAGGDWRQALPAAAAVELLHNFSLVHDDIQDNSPTRHGRPTVWKIWGIANAINVGDAIFSLAYKSLEGLSSNIDAETTVRAWAIFNQTNLELTRGQHLDMRFESQPSVTVGEYISMIRGKSAALISACAQMGALIGSGSQELAQHYADFGLNLGIAFQIRDDILGIWGDPSVTGKSAATDILSRKKSLPVLYALSRNNELVEIYQRPSMDEAGLQRTLQILHEAGSRQYAQESELQFYNQAIESLKKTKPQGDAAKWLNALIETLFERQY